MPRADAARPLFSAEPLEESMVSAAAARLHACLREANFDAAKALACFGGGVAGGPPTGAECVERRERASGDVAMALFLGGASIDEASVAATNSAGTGELSPWSLRWSAPRGPHTTGGMASVVGSPVRKSVCMCADMHRA